MKGYKKIKSYITLVLLRALRISLERRSWRFLTPIVRWIFSLRFRLVISRVCSVHSYVTQKHHPDDEIIEFGSGKGRLMYAASQYDKACFPLTYVDAPPSYLAILNDVFVVAESNLVLTPSGMALSERIAQDTEHRIEFSINMTFAIVLQNGTVVSVLKKDKPIALDCGVMLSGDYSHNYYHLTFEILPRLIYIDQYVPLEVPLLVDHAMLQYPQYRELLEVFNKSKRELIVLESACQTHVGKLYSPSVASYMVPNIKPWATIRLTDGMFDVDSLQFIRSTLLPHRSDKFFGEKIFLYRNSNKRLFNQDEVFERLKGYGYKKVSTEDLSVSDQIALFYNAKEIVSGSGAALTNIIYCSAECRILVLSNGRYEMITYFSTIAKWVGAQMRYIDAGANLNVGSVKLIHEDFYVDPQIVINCINE